METSPLQSPSVQGEYRLPSAAQEGYHVSACVYSACRPVNSTPVSSADWAKGQLVGDSDFQTKFVSASARLQERSRRQTSPAANLKRAWPALVPFPLPLNLPRGNRRRPPLPNLLLPRRRGRKFIPG